MIPGKQIVKRLAFTPPTPCVRNKAEGTISKSHIIIIDGTQSILTIGHETNAGLLYKLLDEARDAKATTLYYDPGIQGHGFWNWVTIASGWGINQMVKEAYDRLASRYVPSDKIYFCSGFRVAHMQYVPFRA